MSIRAKTAFMTLTAGAALALFALSATPAEAKQCIWNKAGFVLRVDWFKPGTVTTTQSTDTNAWGVRTTDYSFAEQPVQTDVIWAASGRCIDRGPTQYQAVLSICGALKHTRVIAYPPEWPESNRIDCSIWEIQTPSTTRYLDIWGTTGVPASGPGGAI
jgi:hypothetical protein